MRSSIPYEFQGVVDVLYIGKSMFVHVYIYIYTCMHYIYRDVDVCTHICVLVVASGLGEVQTPEVVLDFAWVAAPEMPVRSPSSDVTWDLARAFLRGSEVDEGGVLRQKWCRILRGLMFEVLSAAAAGTAAAAAAAAAAALRLRLRLRLRYDDVIDTRRRRKMLRVRYSLQKEAYQICS